MTESTYQLRRTHQPALDVDTVQAASQLLAALADPSGNTLPAEALKALIQTNHKLLNDTDEAIADSLSVQAAVLEAVFLRYTRRAEESSIPQHRHLAMRTALAAQRQLIQTLGAIHTIRSKPHETTSPLGTMEALDGPQDGNGEDSQCAALEDSRHEVGGSCLAACVVEVG